MDKSKKYHQQIQKISPPNPINNTNKSINITNKSKIFPEIWNFFEYLKYFWKSGKFFENLKKISENFWKFNENLKKKILKIWKIFRKSENFLTVFVGGLSVDTWIVC